jgi:hypothetical protein
MSEGVRDNAALKRFELDIDGHQAVAYYRLTPEVITFIHTEVPPALSGQGRRIETDPRRLGDGAGTGAQGRVPMPVRLRLYGQASRIQ